jgi:hypothetical protein
MVHVPATSSWLHGPSLGVPFCALHLSRIEVGSCPFTFESAHVVPGTVTHEMTSGGGIVGVVPPEPVLDPAGPPSLDDASSDEPPSLDVSSEPPSDVSALLDDCAGFFGPQAAIERRAKANATAAIFMGARH